MVVLFQYRVKSNFVLFGLIIGILPIESTVNAVPHSGATVDWSLIADFAMRLSVSDLCLIPCLIFRKTAPSTFLRRFVATRFAEAR
jgi:hypothetical protein